MTFVRPLIRRPLGLHYSPVALYPLTGSLTDISGNGLDVTLETGLEQYAYWAPGCGGFCFNGASNLLGPAAGTALEIAGDLTIEMLIEYLVDPSGKGVNLNGQIVTYAAVGELQSQNSLYDWNTAGGLGAGRMGHLYFCEFGPGTNVAFETIDAAPAGLQLAAMRREAGQVTFFTDGVPMRSTSVGLTPPDGGTASRLRIGASETLVQYITAVVGSVKIIDRALTDAELLDEYGRTLG